ncbi:ureidoglycolate lyase [Undibacterium sp. SXout11W]|uniref:ureidoglycolate lyase n=1 Tax=Undibacterium sp. SXout11W TaxID=3413050 RepID=UPI003BF06388
MPQLPLQTLSREAFAPFGEVIMLEGARHYPINQGTTERFHALAMADTQTQNGKTILSVFRAQPRALPLAIEVMERHPLGSQAFVPLTAEVDDEYLVVVAPPGEFDPTQMQAFFCKGLQGVNYARGVWHHPLIALHKQSDFIVMDRIGEGFNCDEIALDGNWTVG